MCYMTEMTLAAAVAAQLRAERERRGLTQRYVWTTAGVSPMTYTRIETGALLSALTVDRFEAICEAIGVDPAAVLVRARERMV